MSTRKRIAVHDQTFHADDCLSVYFLFNTKEFEGAEVVRTRNQAILEQCDAVCDTGGTYDSKTHRYDHHQPEFNEKFPGSDIPLSSCGTIYLHFGREIITNILAKKGYNIGDHVEYVYRAMYDGFMKEVDANDNGISQYPTDTETLYTIHTGISQRIAWLNINGTFEEAVTLIGKEFDEKLVRVFESEVPALEIARAGFDKRFEIDPSGKIVVFEEACPGLKLIEAFEKETGCDPVLFVIIPANDGSWGLRTMRTGRGFELRKPLPFAGLRDEELSQACGIPGGIFVHRNAFSGGFRTRDGAITFAKLAIND